MLLMLLVVPLPQIIDHVVETTLIRLQRIYALFVLTDVGLVSRGTLQQYVVVLRDEAIQLLLVLLLDAL